MKNYGITGPICNWIEDFLEGRSQRVVCKGEHSQWASVLSRVPQGSIIGPVLFLIPEEVRGKVRVFADDTIMYLTITGERDAASLQKDLDHLADWEEKNGK